MYIYRSRIIDSHIATLAEVDQKMHQSVHFDPLTIYNVAESELDTCVYHTHMLSIDFRMLLVIACMSFYK